MPGASPVANGGTGKATGEVMVEGERQGLLNRRHRNTASILRLSFPRVKTSRTDPPVFTGMRRNFISD